MLFDRANSVEPRDEAMEGEPGSYRPTTFADPANSFHEKAALCRAGAQRRRVQFRGYTAKSKVVENLK